MQQHEGPDSKEREWAGPGRLVWYSKKKWSRAGAWENLLKQMIPGCPKVERFSEDPESVYWGHGWVRCHGRYYWAWIYKAGL